jgi:AsmA protein
MGSAQLAEGGSVSFGATADATVLPPAITASLKAANAAVAPLAGAAGIGFVSGSGNFSASVAASGLTQEEMVGTLKGQARIDFAQGQFAGTSAADLFARVRQQVVEGWGAPAGTTPFTSLTADATISDGILAIGQFALDGPDLSLSLTGGIDLLRRALDLRASPRLKAAGADEAAALPVPIVVHGPWESPRLYPDVPNLLKDPKAGYEALGQMALPSGN